jgi:predicted nucleotide-binding protein
MRPGEPGEAPGQSSTNVFLAYAKEDQTVANAAKDALEDYAVTQEDIKICVRSWPLSPKVGRSVLENLLSKMSECLFGVFLLTPIDEIKSGDVERLGADDEVEAQRAARAKMQRRLIARDNVILETGLFIGMRGPDYTFMLRPESYDVTPSDLKGIIGIPYDYDKVRAAGRSDERKDAIRQACDDIVDGIREVMARPQSSAVQPPPSTAQESLGAGRAQPNSPLDLLGATLMADAAMKNLPGLREEDLIRGQLVVHALHGVGQIVAFDPPYVTVRFSSPPDRSFDIAELFAAPRRE